MSAGNYQHFTLLQHRRSTVLLKNGTPRAPISAHLPLLPSGPGGFSEMTPREESRDRVRAGQCACAKWLWVISPTEDSPSGLWRSLGKRVGLTPSGVRIPYPPPSISFGTEPRLWKCRLWTLPVVGVSDPASCGEVAPAIARGSIHHLTPNFLCPMFKPSARFVKVLDHGVEWRAVARRTGDGVRVAGCRARGRCVGVVQ